ncbi:MAG: hypothetical protein BalsKO_12910 [Balneolaceae bacterium]
MNVLLVIEGTYPWYRGGVSEWIYRYIETCKSYTFSILQIATDPFFDLNPEDALYPLPENISEFTRISPPDLVNSSDLSLQNWFDNEKPRFKNLIEGKELIHVTNTGFAGWLGLEISKTKEIPLILTEHAIYWLEVIKGAVALECGYKIPEGSDSKDEVVHLFKKIAKSLYSSASEVITVSECNIILQEQLGASKVTYIPNGIPASWILNSDSKRNTPVIGWVGRCAEMKNPLQFFDFVEEFQSQGFQADFLMLLSDAGEDSLKNDVIKRASSFDSISLVWNKPSREYYKRMDMLLITSHNESQPLVMFEALANKVLPFGRQVGDLTNKYGLTFPVLTSIDSMCREIHRFWNNKELFSKYVEERHLLVKENHTWSNIFSKYESVIQKKILEFNS